MAIWLDASHLNDGLSAAGKSPLQNDQQVSLWPDGSGNRRDLIQTEHDSCPGYKSSEEFRAVSFGGVQHYLQHREQDWNSKELTAFVVAATYSNPDSFTAWFSFSSDDTNDYQSGFNVDQLIGNPGKLQVVSVEGAGQSGADNLLRSPHEYGAVTRLCISSMPGPNGTALWVNGSPQGKRDRTESSMMSLTNFVLGARRYTHGGPPQQRGFLHADIAEVLIYDRKLDTAEREAIESYLEQKYGDVPRQPIPSIDTGGKALVRVEPSIPVQVLRPGFTVRRLPVDLPNINNVRYRADGQLIALGYDGNVWKLNDSDGDGLEETADLFWKNQGQLRAPIGMALTPQGYSKGQGLFVAAKGKCTLLVDTDEDDVADSEIIVADGWEEIANHVDALGVAIDPADGSVFFGLGTTDYANAYLLDKKGKPEYTIENDHGTIVKVSPDFKSRETYSTGIRFPVGLHFNREGDLFCTDQEGATWLPNGNPFDEFLHIQKGRHYGFPPRHPSYLPDVIDEPSTFDYKPQHQSTCGFCFNDPVNQNGPVFGPDQWSGDAFVTGYSRGKLYRTQLVKSATGYVARNELFACLNMLTADCCVTPDGGLLVACHSGGPDWGSGPAGRGTLFKIEYNADAVAKAPAVAQLVAQPVAIWPTSPREVRIEFDRPVDPELFRNAAELIDMSAGEFVSAGDQFESFWPGYSVVQMQQRTKRKDVRVYSAQLTSDRRALLLATDPLQTAMTYAVTIPISATDSNGPIDGDNRLAQLPQFDLSFEMTGCEATWQRDEQVLWRGWLPTIDLQASRKWTVGSAFHDQLWDLMSQEDEGHRGQLTIRLKADLDQMLRPEIQPGSKIDFQWHPEIVTLVTSDDVSLAGAQMASGNGRLLEKGQYRFDAPSSLVSLELDCRIRDGEQIPNSEISYFTNDDATLRPFPPSRSFVPWTIEPSEDASTKEMVLSEIEGGSWAAGFRLFHDTKSGCAKCHTIHGRGGVIGPDLSNLSHRDYASVFRDITQPSFAINPDFLVSTILLDDGRVLTGSIRTVDGMLHVGDSGGKTTVIDPEQVERLQPSTKSVMPEGLLKDYSSDQVRDLMTFLLTRGPSMPVLSTSEPAPPARSITDVRRVLDGAPENVDVAKPLKIVLVGGAKDHGPGEHDYPAWLTVWKELFSVAENVVLSTAMQWPSEQQLSDADVLVFYQRGDWNAERAKAIDSHLKRGGGLVYIHWAVDGQANSNDLAKRIGLSWGQGSLYRHGPLELNFSRDNSNPITRGFNVLRLVDESYWNLTGDLANPYIIATGIEQDSPQPLFWAKPHENGRVFVSIPGHYSWTFDDPLYRVLLLRGIAWSAGESVDRFNSLVLPGANVTH
ncbi:ThuA domain-containing protein [Stieleria sp. JC731]|uniref:ThuA domain-containing protein n=1 Tax=Stieleria sp. JC731 TaxID=2894195 RepID=UPI001E326312|nr:ThuA domain-containing protein [Stieleria sp. JC731]MCC9600260.1 ThuA domain-containing protein [Stieleria sp. JC731]